MASSSVDEQVARLKRENAVLKKELAALRQRQGASQETDWLGAPSAAACLGIQVHTLYRLVDEGGLPSYRIGRVLRIRRSDLDEWLEGQRVQPGALRNLYPGGQRSDPAVSRSRRRRRGSAAG